jgi:hypothetical protein
VTVGALSTAYELELRRLRLLVRRRVETLRKTWQRDAQGDDFGGIAITDAQVDRILAAEAARDTIDPALAFELEEVERELELQTTAVDALAEAFALTKSERDTVLLLFAPELDAGFEALFGYLHDDASRRYVSAHLAAPLTGAVDLTTEGALRRWGLVHVEPPPQPAMPLAARPLRLDACVVDHLHGVTRFDELVAEVLRPLERGPLAAEHARIADELAKETLVNLIGSPQTGKETLAHSIAQRSGRTVHRLDPRRLPPLGPERTATMRALARDARLLRLAYYVQPPERDDANSEVAMADIVETLDAPLFVDTRDAWGGARRLAIVRVERPTRNSQRLLWLEVLSGMHSSRPGEGDDEGPPAGRYDRQHWLPKAERTPLAIRAVRAQTNAAGHTGPPEASGRSPLPGEMNASGSGVDPAVVDDLVEQFDFSPEMIARAARAADRATDARTLWDVCQQQVSWRIDDLAQRITTRQQWDDLVLEADPTAQLREISAQVALRARVYEHWGFAARLTRGRGITALFAGPSGTGKTMAAEILAGELGLELYRIDLAGVVSKYIGESEKNLRRVFDAAEQSGAILFFDEADALFGKRTDVKDSHDLYANIQVNYLLQRMEDYAGLAILATNRKTALDRAFLRRLRFVVDFPFPDAASRERIWRNAFPPATPIGRIDFEFLSRLEIAGGNIRNIALGAAFLAASDGGAIEERHVMHAVRREYAKIQKLVTETEFGTHYRERR